MLRIEDYACLRDENVFPLNLYDGETVLLDADKLKALGDDDLTNGEIDLMKVNYRPEKRFLGLVERLDGRTPIMTVKEFEGLFIDLETAEITNKKGDTLGFSRVGRYGSYLMVYHNKRQVYLHVLVMAEAMNLLGDELKGIYEDGKFKKELGLQVHHRYPSETFKVGGNGIANLKLLKDYENLKVAKASKKLRDKIQDGEIKLSEIKADGEIPILQAGAPLKTANLNTYKGGGGSFLHWGNYITPSRW